MALRALASVNLAAIERNVRRLRSMLAPSTALCAVVKADGYGHGAVQSAHAALAGGAASLAVATAREAAELRAAGLSAPVLVMGAVSSDELPEALGAGAELVAWSEEFVERAEAAAAGGRPVRLHVKLDTGMGRLGTRERDRALDLAGRISGRRGLVTLAGAMTHFATADEDPEFLAAQLAAFEPFATALKERSPEIAVHCANSAAIITAPASHRDMVRPGISIYGGDPMNEDPAVHGLEPALELTSYVAAVKLTRAGESVGYGRKFIAQQDTWIATLPIGYADGIRRALENNCDVLLDGRRYPLVGAVSMDNITLDLGESAQVAVGAPATIIGTDGGEHQSAEQIARRMGTINYELLCGISARVPRAYHRDGAPA